MHKRNGSMRVLAGVLASGVLAVGCEPMTGGEEGALMLSRQQVRAQPKPTLAGGTSFVLALRPNQEVWAWGNNQNGQLGNGLTTSTTSPVKVQGLPEVTVHNTTPPTTTTVAPVSVGAGFYHSLAVMDDGTVRAWGSNGSGQLGDGTLTQRTTPVKVSGLSGVTAVAAGYFHSLAVDSNGTAWAWGGNQQGQLGDGTNTDRKTPQAVLGICTGSVAVAVAAGENHSLALCQDGTVWAWGYNNRGQLGVGSSTLNSKVPMTVSLSGLTGASNKPVDVAAGQYYSLAVLTDGSVVGWGDNSYLQLGGTTTSTFLIPTLIPQFSGVSFVAGSPSNANNHTIAMKGDGTIWTWGHNEGGQLGHGQNACPWGTGYKTGTPTQPSNFSGSFTSVATASVNSFAQRSDGTVWVWGTDSWGLWGDGGGSGGCTQTPRQVPGLP